MGSVQIAVRLPGSDLAALDAAVARGAFPSRAAAIRAGLEALLSAEREHGIAEAYRRAYAASPVDREDDALGRAGLELAAQALAGREPDRA